MSIYIQEHEPNIRRERGWTVHIPGEIAQPFDHLVAAKGYAKNRWNVTRWKRGVENCGSRGKPLRTYVPLDGSFD